MANIHTINEESQESSKFNNFYQDPEIGSDPKG